MGLIRAAEAKIIEGVRLLAKVERPVLLTNGLVRDLLLKSLDSLRGVLLNLQTQTVTAIAEAVAPGEDRE